MNLLITGALGHIGSQLIRDLPLTFPGSQLVLLDNLTTQRYCSLFHLPDYGNYRFIEADILQEDLERQFEGVDVVVHLAALTDAANSFEREQEVMRINLEGSEKVARACASNGCRLLFPSTTSVYGVQEGWVDETCPDSALKPQSPYATSKLRAERLLLQLGKESGLHFTIFRFGTIFGVSPGMRFHTAVNKFIWQACAGTPLTVWREAMNQQRPYLDLRDATRAITQVIVQDHFRNQIYNVASLNTSVQDIIQNIQHHVPHLELHYVDSPIMNQLSYQVSSSLFESLGFQFRGNLSERIEETVKMMAGMRGLGKFTGSPQRLPQEA